MNLKQKAELLDLALFLEKLPPENFDMEDYGEHISGSVQHEIDCETACCVAGWAGRKYQSDWPVYQFTSGGSIPNIGAVPFASYFGLTNQDSITICLDGYDMTKEQKAEQIRDIVKKYKTEQES